jgi:hypothetical protein
MHNLFSNEEEGLDKIHDGRLAFSRLFCSFHPFINAGGYCQRKVALSYQQSIVGSWTCHFDLGLLGRSICRI